MRPFFFLGMKLSNARIDAAGDIEPSIQSLRMKAALLPLASNELLDRPSIVASSAASEF
jgi:hypothetical protein